MKEELFMKKHDYRILAANEMRDNNTRLTGLNNNDLIIGPSGAGKPAVTSNPICSNVKKA